MTAPFRMQRGVARVYMTPDEIALAGAKGVQQFGITPPQFVALMDAQGGVCAICGKPPEGVKRLAIDHDHACCPRRRGGPWKRACGKCVRGLLCSHCNTGLGLFMDSPEALRAAANYLERPTPRESQ